MYELHLICGNFATVGYQRDVYICGVIDHNIQCNESSMTLDVLLAGRNPRPCVYCTTIDECGDQSIEGIENGKTLQWFLQNKLFVVNDNGKLVNFNVLAHKNDKHLTIIFGDKLNKIVKVERTTIFG